MLYYNDLRQHDQSLHAGSRHGQHHLVAHPVDLSPARETTFSSAAQAFHGRREDKTWYCPAHAFDDPPRVRGEDAVTMLIECRRFDPSPRARR